MLKANMADKNKEDRGHGVQQVGGTTEENQNVDTTDDFDPFSGVVECVDENVDIALSAPPENQWVINAMWQIAQCTVG